MTEGIFTDALEREFTDTPTHAGIAVQAADTGRILLQQRAMDPTDDPAVQGTWEFPGGGLEDDESPIDGAWREWQEETGLDKPDHEIVGGWTSPDGVYQCFVAMVDNEDAIGNPNTHSDGNGLDNPDDTQRDHPDVAAWFTIEHVQDMGSAIRPEVLASTDWSQFAPTMSEDPTPEGADMTIMETDEPTEMADVVVNWYGVLAPEGVKSGDGRMFAENSLRNRDLPLPLTWQKVGTSGHDNRVTVGRIDNIFREDGLLKGEGIMLSTPEAQEAIALIAAFGRFGVSVDADDVTEVYEEDGVAVFADARVSSACIVDIPAFQQAFVALGTWAQEGTPVEADAEFSKGGSLEIGEELFEEADEEGRITEAGVREDGAVVYELDGEFRDIPSDQRDDMADSGAAMPDGSYPIANCDDLKNAIQAIGRAKDPAATKAHIRKRKNALGCPDVELPDTWAAEVEPFVVTEDGPGWLTHPVDTDRLRDYWVRGEGAAKINWGTPGDFDRCRAELAKYVKPEYLAGYCANRHYDALGFWPGRPVAGDVTAFSSAISLVAAAPRQSLPKAWFSDPLLEQPTALTITPEGEIYGHLATWGTCHIGFDGICVEPPTSQANYAYFLTGQVQTDGGPVAVGQISMGGGHADPRLRFRPAVAHYDQTSAAVADVSCGEDSHGIWIHGAIREGVSPNDVATLAASGGLSGDWRAVAGNLELVAALAVNVPGFPVPRVQIAASNGEQIALVAAGIVDTDDSDPIGDIATEVERIINQRAEARVRQEALRVKTHGARIEALRSRLGEDN